MIAHPKPEKYRNPAYLKWISKQPCIVCGMQAEPHHIRHLKFGAGTGTKSHDYCAIPLCRKHHNDEHAMPYLDATLVDVGMAIIDNLMRYIEHLR